MQLKVDIFNKILLEVRDLGFHWRIKLLHALLSVQQKLSSILLRKKTPRERVKIKTDNKSENSSLLTGSKKIFYQPRYLPTLPISFNKKTRIAFSMELFIIFHFDPTSIECTSWKSVCLFVCLSSLQDFEYRSFMSYQDNAS